MWLAEHSIRMRSNPKRPKRGQAAEQAGFAPTGPAPHLTVAELLRFRQMRKSGALSPVRSAACARCREEIPESFLYCSRECWERETHVA
jgi:hypothetical protein